MSYERITKDKEFDGPVRESHELRYRIAGLFVNSGDVVIDACCGTGYGFEILRSLGEKNISWIGLDKDPCEDPPAQKFDFELDEHRSIEISHCGISTLPAFDVFVGLEAIEHLNDFGVSRFVHLAKLARRWIIVSTPIVPNKNPYHKQNFKEEDIIQLFGDDRWRHYATLKQGDVYGIFIFKNKRND